MKGRRKQQQRGFNLAYTTRVISMKSRVGATTDSGALKGRNGDRGVRQRERDCVFLEIGATGTNAMGLRGVKRKGSLI